MSGIASVICLVQNQKIKQNILGEGLPTEALSVISELCKSKPVVKKIAESTAIGIPLENDGHMIWIFDALLSVKELPAHVKQLIDLSALLVKKPNIENKQGNEFSQFISQSVQIADKSTAGKIKNFLSIIASVYNVSNPFLFKIKNNKIKNLWSYFKDNEISVVDMQNLMNRFELNAGEVELTNNGNDEINKSIEAKNFLDNSKLSNLHLQFPSVGKIYGIGLSQVTDQFKIDLPLILDVIEMQVQKREGMLAKFSKKGRLIFYGLLAAFCVWMAYPSHSWVNGQAQATAERAIVFAVPANAYLKEILVKPGQQVTDGQLLARFYSPELEELENELELQIKIEELTARESLAKNEYAKFQLAEERKAIIEAQLNNTLEKAESLNLVSNIDGKVIFAISGSITGSFIKYGDSIVEVQVSRGYDSIISVPATDINLIKSGSEGNVYFRGIGDEKYTVKITTPPVIQENEKTQQRIAVARAHIISGDTEKLVQGLTGYAQIYGKRQPNILNYSRHIIEYVRIRLWKYLGLQF